MQDLRRRWRNTQNLGIRIADWGANAIGTWGFIFLYSTGSVLWIYLHRSGVLKMDSPDFSWFTLWLSVFAGIQASIVLMSTTRQSFIDRVKHDEAFEIDRESLLLAKEHQEKITNLVYQINELEQVIEDLLEDKERRG